MSTLQATNLKHGSSASNNLVLDANGNVTAAGTVAMATPFAMRNKIINGAMEIDQRNAGASVTVNSSASTYGVDRWKGQASGGGVYTQQRSTTAPAGFINSVLLTVTTADSSIASTDYYIFGQAIEGFNAADLNWGTANAKTITLSFWVRSSVTGTYALFVGNNADNRSLVATYTISSANTWEQKSVTIAGDTSGTWTTDNSIGIGLWFTLGAGSSFNATANVWNGSLEMNTSGSTNWIATNGATFYITGVQLEVGTVATPFERRLYPQELAMCQRYFSSIGGTNGNEMANVGSNQAYSTTQTAGVLIFPVEMRAAPTFSVSSASHWTVTGAAYTTTACTAITMQQAGLRTGQITSTIGAANLVAGYASSFQASTTNARMSLSAEL